MIALVPHCAYLSETSRMAEIYLALKARGEEACVVTHGGSHEFYLREQGIPYEVLEPRMDDARCREFVKNGAGMGPPNQSMYTDDEMRAQVAAQVRFFRERGVRAAVTGFTLTTLLSTRVAAIPLIASHAGSSVPPVYERGIFPAPSAGPLSWLPDRVHRWLSNYAVQRLKMHCAGFNRVAAELGVSGFPTFADLMLGDLTLVTDLPEIVGISEPDMHAWTPRRAASYRPGATLRYAGPIFARSSATLDEATERFLADEARPTVYVAITSAPEATVRAAVDSLKAAEHRLVVASTVHDLSDLADGETHVERYFPSHLVMPRVAAAVIAGGQGSVQTAAASGTPFVGLPLQPEQDLNIRLHERQGAAILVPLARAAEVAAGVGKLLDEPKYAAAAERLRALYARVDGPTRATDHIVEYLGGRAKAQPSSSRATV